MAELRRYTDGFVLGHGESSLRTIVRSCRRNAQLVDLADADLSFTELYSSNFQAAMFRNACFAGCDLRDSNCVGVEGDYADFRGARLGGVNFESARLRYADFRGADFGYNSCDMTNADLSHADFRGAYNTEAIWPRYTVMANVNFTGCKWPRSICGFGDGSDIDLIDTSLVLEMFERWLQTGRWGVAAYFHSIKAVWQAVFDETLTFTHAKMLLNKHLVDEDDDARRLILAVIHPKPKYRPKSVLCLQAVRHVMKATVPEMLNFPRRRQLERLEKIQTNQSVRGKRKKANAEVPQ